MIRRSFWVRVFAASFAAALGLYAFVPSLEAQAVSWPLYLPILQAADTADIGLALSNPTLSPVTVTLTARDYNGTTISGAGITNPAAVTLPASGQQALRAIEIFGTGITDKIGWVE